MSQLPPCRVLGVMTLLLLLVVGNAAAQPYTLRSSDSITGTGSQEQGHYVAMSGTGLVSVSLPGSAPGVGPLVAIAPAPGMPTVQTYLTLPPPCFAWSYLQPSVSSSGNMLGVMCVDASINWLAVIYRSSNLAAPFAILAGVLPSLSNDGSTLAIASFPGNTVTVYKLTSGTYSIEQIITASFGTIQTMSIAPDASAIVFSDQASSTAFYGWDSSTSQFLSVPTTPLGVGCVSLASSSKSAAGITAIACAALSDTTVYALLNSMGFMSLSTQSTIGSGATGVSITPDGSTVAVANLLSGVTTTNSASSGAMIASIAEGAYSVALSADAATVLLGDYIFGSNAGRAVWYDSSVPPVITMHPADVSVSTPATATFTAAATGYATVQWYFTGSVTRRGALASTLIVGATSPSYTTNPTTLAFNGNTYSATFTSAAGMSTSTLIGTLTVTLGSSGSASGDPHVVGFDGRKYELVGERHGVYNLVTDTCLQLNVRLGNVKATNHLDLPGLFMLEAGIKFDNHSLVVDAGSFDRQGMALLDGKPMQPPSSPSMGEAELVWFESPMVGDRFGLPHLEHVTGVVTVLVGHQYQVEVFFAESGLEPSSHRPQTPLRRRFLDVRVTVLTADAAPHGILGQSAAGRVNKRRDASASSSSAQQSSDFEIEGSIGDYRVRDDALLGDSFAFNLFVDRSTTTNSANSTNAI